MDSNGNCLMRARHCVEVARLEFVALAVLVHGLAVGEEVQGGQEQVLG